MDIAVTDQSFALSSFLRPTVEIVASFLGNNAVQTSELSALIGDVHGTLARLNAKASPASPEPLKPAVPIKRSIQSDYLVCLNDGKRFRSLKRHLKSKYGMTPDDYRAHWSLPADYPMVAPGYARERSQLAKAMGLGQQRRRSK